MTGKTNIISVDLKVALQSSVRGHMPKYLKNKRPTLYQSLKYLAMRKITFEVLKAIGYSSSQTNGSKKKDTVV